MEKTATPDPSRPRNGVVDVLYGEFTDTSNSQVWYSVSLTESALTVQNISSSYSSEKAVFKLVDCIGCRAHREKESADFGAYFTSYFYPTKSRWISSSVTRQSVERRFRVALSEDPSANLQEAERWARAIRNASVEQIPRREGVQYSQVRHPYRVMLLVNPQSGRGQGLQLFTAHVQTMFTQAAVLYTLLITEHQNHAKELVRQADLSQWDALVILAGDGLLSEVVNGLMEREDWEEAVQIPLGILPGGSGNALAASIHHYSQSPPAWSEDLLLSCGFLLCKGLVGRLDLVSVQLCSHRRLFSFLSLAWGFVADVDTESEKYRYVGTIRFLLGTLVRMASLKIYQGRLAFLPVQGAPKVSQEMENQASISTPPCHPSLCPSLSCQPTSMQDNCNQNPKAVHTSTSTTQGISSTPQPAGYPAHQDPLLPGLDQPLPASWRVVEDEDFVLVLAIYQSHLSEDLVAVPGATADDGVIHLLYIRAGISRPALLKLFLAMEKGTHLSSGCPHLVYEKVLALRLEPHSSQGVITVDGETVEYGPIQAQVHPGLARLITG